MEKLIQRIGDFADCSADAVDICLNRRSRILCREKRKSMKLKLFTILLIIYSLVMLTACPSRVTLEKAKQKSSQIAGYANDATEAIRDLYRAKILTAEQTVLIADKIILLAKGGQAFDTAIKSFEEVYGTIENVPQTEWANALNLFNREVVEAFVAVLVELKVIQQSEQLKQTINLIIAAVRIIARALSVEKPTMARIAAAQ